jgi:hypothetical protein
MNGIYDTFSYDILTQIWLQIHSSFRLCPSCNRYIKHYGTTFRKQGLLPTSGQKHLICWTP